VSLGRGGSTPLTGTISKLKMSDNFLDFQFPCKDCLVRAVCEEKPEIKDDDKKKLYERDRTHCLTIPYISKEKHYHKMLIECWANMGKSLFDQVSNVEHPHKMNSDLKVPIWYIFKLRDIANLAQWIVNSTSWEKGDLKKFDQDEVNRKAKGIGI
jgi:hypothetical protein